MIKLPLQFFAKGSSGARRGSAGGGHARDIHENNNSKKEEPKKEEPKKERPKAKTKGESVTAVSRDAVYEVYVIDHNREIYVADRHGSDILKKMAYRKDRGAWISNGKGYRYVVRKKT